MSELNGNYQLVAGERDGRPLPPDHIHNSVVRFTADTVVVKDKDDRRTYAATYRLDTAEKPWRITMTATEAPDAGETAAGLIEKDGDTVKLIYALPGQSPPTDFRTKSGDRMFVMKSGSK
jgi:uncharacterized protein (TIGR03067 family)